MRTKRPILRVLQLTDTHLSADAGQRLAGVDTAESLGQVLALARQWHWPPDLLLLTGDLAEQPSPRAYRRLLEILGDVTMPVGAIPGNHDDPKLLAASLAAQGWRTAPRILQGSWQIILLDSTVPGAVAGALAADQLELLEHGLSELPEHYALVVLHHPPVPVGSPWMDAMGLRQPSRLLEILDNHPQVRGLLWGHAHQAYDGTRGGIRLMGSPSTCIQFLPGALELALDDRPAGYRWLELAADGGIHSGVCRVGNQPGRCWSEPHGGPSA